MERTELLNGIAVWLASRDFQHPMRVGVDGICGAGKTTFASGLAAAIAATGRTVIHLDPDGFHNVREVRYRQGRDSARGYYEDAFAFESFEKLTLEPLGPSGNRRYVHHLHDLESDLVRPRWATAPQDAIVVFDETFIQRGSMREHWDEVIFLDVPRHSAIERGAKRDAILRGGEQAAREAFENRYMAACDLYLAEERPTDRASIVIDNSNPILPRLLRGPGALTQSTCSPVARKTSRPES